MPAPLLILAVPLLINLLRWLVQKFIIKFCIKRLCKRTAAQLLRKFLIDNVNKLPKSRLTERLLKWLKEATDEEIGLLLEPESAIFKALERFLQGKTNRVEINQPSPQSMLRGSDAEIKEIDWNSMLGGEIKRPVSEPYAPPPSTQTYRYGIDRGYGNTGIGNLFKY